ncbi:uncharacterized protein CTRU02_208118 [Colletotrichum truncatum]|uniref:Uncharacterized protein n=1 Tax=Colletotrichum truncatum TaxID=5467 RepID=A0ACC3YVD5_COLTU|nr:uncharacterized protein CTRU02_14983 [Colletotrichum truncatum]KAF6781576.1 hypothetical protein CTRU02_14983 [Colletotrichum truncatum]
MNELVSTFVLGAPDFPAIKKSVSESLSNMGGASSRPPPPPRVATTLTSTTVWVRHLPPIISSDARQAIHSAIQLRNRYLAGDETSSGPQAVASLVERLETLIEEAREAANIRDFVVLAIESTILSLTTDYGAPSKRLLDLARAVNPFLNQQDGTTEPGPSSSADGGLPVPFRQSDLALIDDPEKDLLVLLHYCDIANLKSSPDETVAQLSKMADKYGTIKDLDLRKEHITECEVYIHWTIMYLTSNLSTLAAPTAFSLGSGTKLDFEKSIQMSRLLTISEMLIKDARSDQVCFLLMFLRRCATNQEKTWWRSRTKGVLKGLKKTRSGKGQWHVDFAEKNLASLKRLEEDGEERWSRRGSLMIEREELEMGKMKGD